MRGGLDWKAMSALRSVRAVSFDAMHTLVRPKKPIGHTYAEIAATSGVEVDPQLVHKAFKAQYRRHSALHPAFAFNSPHLAVPDCQEAAAAHPAKKFWLSVILSSFGQAGVKEETKVLVPVAEEIFDHFRGAEPWELLPGVHTLLTALQRKGLELLVISNWDYRLKEVLDAKGIGQYFASVTVAGEVGVEKPSEELFRIAITATKGLQASEAGAEYGSYSQVLHVGDDVERDYWAALRAGLQARLLLSRPQAIDEKILSRIPPQHVLRDISHLIQHV